MYSAHFALQEQPFSITPDPGYLYLSAYHQEALAHLIYGTEENGGFVQLTGEVGTGKTTLIRALLEQPIANVDIALCLNPRLTVVEFLALICDELNINYDPAKLSLKLLIDSLNNYLLQAHAVGKRTVLIVDEAQNLHRDVLEQVRLLTNLETRRHKLLRVILVGQPELRDLLNRRDLRQLAQRITARYHLEALDRKETAAYISHRLRVAGAQQALFSSAALRSVYRHSKGIPRLINIICDRALLGAYVNNRHNINAATVRQAAREALQGSGYRAKFHIKTAITAVGLSVIAAVAVSMFAKKDFFTAYFATKQTAVAILETLDNTEQENADPEVAALAVTEPEVTEPEVIDSAEPPDPLKNKTPIAQMVDILLAEPELEAAIGAKPQLDVITADNIDDVILAAKTDDFSALISSSNLVDDAMTRLLALWGVQQQIPPGEYPCEQLKQKRLHCLSGQADWQILARYNRPAILQLVTETGQTKRVLLSGIVDEMALMDIGGQQYRVSMEQIDPLWTGEFLLTWRPPTSITLIGPGVRGEAVLWLRRQLAQTLKLPLAEPISDAFDNNLQNLVKQFQRDHDLAVDGLVGQQTMLLLNSLSPSPGTPVLFSDQV